MFTSRYLSQNAHGVEFLFLFTLICVILYTVGCLSYKNGRTGPALLRAAVGLVVAEVMTELAYYLGYLGYFPGHEPMTESARMFPTVVFPVLFFGCVGLFIKVLNDMLR